MSTVTFDLFSALIDSRSGGGATFATLAGQHGWQVSGEQVYDAWDARNKSAQRDCPQWVPYPTLAHAALADTYAALGIEAGDADVARDLTALLDSLPQWPLWPDVHDVLPAVAGEHAVGILSNVDDDLFARTRAAALVRPELVVTSERLGVYKPDPAIYHGARRLLGPMVHVATSGRDVRGALEAGMTVVRLRRSGHRLDADGPRPHHEAAGMVELRELLAQVSAG